MNNMKKIVVKIGTKVIASKDKGIDRERIKDLAGQISDIQKNGPKVLLVTSGAIGAGMWVLGLKKRPTDLSELQAAAAIGQNYLMQIYSEYFMENGHVVGQILLTQEDFNDRKRYLNIRHTINALLAHNAIPIINENDTVATEEIKCGDNDRLSSLVVDLCGADRLILLTDVDGLLDPDGNVIRRVTKITPKLLGLAGKSRCDLGTGGMASKIESARNVMNAGIECVIANGKKKGILAKIMAGQEAGTTFKGQAIKYLAKKRWIAYSSRPKGSIAIDDGALKALKEKDKSLLASGIVSVQGRFSAGEVISVTDKAGREIARGVAGYGSDEMLKIKGFKSSDFEDALGYKGPDEAIHKDNLVIL